MHSALFIISLQIYTYLRVLASFLLFFFKKGYDNSNQKTVL